MRRRRQYRGCGGYKGTKAPWKFRDTATTRLLWGVFTVGGAVFTGLYFSLSENAYIPSIAWALTAAVLGANTTKRRRFYAYMAIVALVLHVGIAIAVQVFFLTFMRDFLFVFLDWMGGAH